MRKLNVRLLVERLAWLLRHRLAAVLWRGQIIAQKCCVKDFAAFIENDLNPKKRIFHPRSGLCRAQIKEKLRSVETFWCQGLSSKCHVTQDEMCLSRANGTV